MNSTERRLKIYDILMENETVDVSALSAMFNVSPMTIRRDLAMYENQGLITTTYGGAYLNRKAPENNGFTPLPMTVNEEMRSIGKAAGKLLSYGDRVFLEAGAVSPGLVYGLKLLKLTVMTNSLLAANILHSFSNIRLIMMPGDYDSEISGFLSSATIGFLRNYHFEVAVLNGTFVDTSAGLTADTELEAHLKATAIDCADRNFVLLKSEAIGKIGFAQAATLQKLGHLVTDRFITPEQVASFEKRGLEVVVGE